MSIVVSESPDFPDLKIVAEVGRGTTGVVYRAQDLRVRREVALKVLLPDPTTDWYVRAHRFLREAQVMASLEDPNIPAVYSVGEDHGRPYLTREFVEGVTLEDAVLTGSITVSAGINIVARLAGAVIRLHERGLVHRNLRPQNVLIARDGTPKLIGFSRVGVADAPAAPGMPDNVPETDVRALQGILAWLFTALRQPWPSCLASIRPPNSLPSAQALGSLLAKAARPWWQFWR